MSDHRAKVYEDLHRDLEGGEHANRESARLILDILWEYYQPISALDVGCGIGSWIAAVQVRGITDVRGIDGPWIGKANIVCDRALLQVCDLEGGFALGRSFELAICLEVAEHLSSAAADRLVESLVDHAPAIMFSAAIPFQGGTHHINEQFLSYWVERFARHGYRPIDIFRGRIWSDARVLLWLRQNLVLFAHDKLLKSNEKLGRAAAEHLGPVSIVHPDVYASRIQSLLKQSNQYKQLCELLRVGGMFRSTVIGKGAIRVKKIKQRQE